MQKLNTIEIPNKKCSSFYSVQIVSSCSRHLNIQGKKKTTSKFYYNKTFVW